MSDTETTPGTSSGVKPPKPLSLLSKTADVWEDWSQSFEWYAVATQLEKKPPRVQVATFMTIIGPEAQGIFKTFNLTGGDLTNLALIKEKFKERFTPKVNHAFERYRFNKMSQQEGETFNDFLTSLKLQINKCKFEQLNDELLRDKIIVGIRNNDVREKLLSDPEITLDKVTQLCQASEQAQSQLKQLSNEEARSVDIVSRGQWQNKFTKPQSRESVRPKAEVKQGDNQIQKCQWCAREHIKGQCPAFKATCHFCKKIGHFAIVCRNRNRQYQKQIDFVEETEPDEELFISMVSKPDCLSDDWFETILFPDNHKLSFKLDTGAQCNILPLSDVKEMGLKTGTSTVKRVISYTHHQLKVVGETRVICQIKGQAEPLRFIIVDAPVTPILGRPTCVTLGLVKRVTEVSKTEAELPVQKEDDIFKGIGHIKNFVYDIDLKEPENIMSIRPPRRVPHAIQTEVKKELDRMAKMGIIESIQEPTPIVSQMAVVRKGGKIRICLDPVDVNAHILRRHYPLKTVEEIAARIKGAKYFTKLDQVKGFWQIEVTERSRKYLTFATPWGRYCFLRLPFGIASAPEIFQMVVSGILEGLTGVENSMDDILIYAATPEELKNRSEAVIDRLRSAGVKLNYQKCEFNKQAVKFLGHVLTANGMEIDKDKVEAIDRISEPTNREELRRLLGMINYLTKFVPALSDKIEPLRRLNKQDFVWEWTQEQTQALKEVKKLLRQAPTLEYYDVNAPITLSVDASSKALGAALMQEGKPIAYASTALTPSQMSYPQIEKEALAIRYGCKKFHQYIYGKQLTIETDHKPLQSISRKPLSLAPPRLQRLLLEVQAYSPVINYRKGVELVVADLLSRDCRLEYDPEFEEEDFEVQLVLPMSNKTEEELRQAGEEDAQVSAVKRQVLQGWPESIRQLPELVKPYWNIRDELTVYQGLLMKGERLVIPNAWREKILKQIHLGHLGEESCLKRARDCVYWPGMGIAIKNTVSECPICQSRQRKPPSEPILHKEIPKLPWERVASDLFSYARRDYIVIVDSYSGFVDVEPVQNQTSQEIVGILKRWFRVHGIPQVLETENGPCYNSIVFKEFAKEWAFKHETSSPHHHQGNGLAERAVQTVKNLIAKCGKDGTDVNRALLNFHNTPRDSALGSPAQRLFSRRTRSNLPMSREQLKPQIIVKVNSRLVELRIKQKKYADTHSKGHPKMKVGDQVRLQVGHREWVPSEITREADQPRSVWVKTPSGKVRRNTRFIRPTKAKWRAQGLPVIETEEASDSSQTMDGTEQDHSHQETTLDQPLGETAQQSQNGPPPTVTRSGRVVKPVVRMNL